MWGSFYWLLWWERVWKPFGGAQKPEGRPLFFIGRENKNSAFQSIDETFWCSQLGQRVTTDTLWYQTTCQVQDRLTLLD